MFIDLTGKKYGRLTVLNREPNKKTHTDMWKCQCDCGNFIITRASSLKRGTTQSCGCLQKEVLSKMSSKHNMTHTRLYSIWRGMKARCYSKNMKEFEIYGGRGIKVCNEWLDKENGFMNFYTWATANGYKDNLTLDRINNDGNYEPNNCRWLTMKEQAYNRRNNHYITYNNKTHTITDWGRYYNINTGTIYSRLQSGWSIEKALTTPVRKRRK